MHLTERLRQHKNDLTRKDINHFFLKFTFESLNWQCKLFGPLRVRLANIKFQNQLKDFLVILFNQSHTHS